jgi:hypothetical protein
MADTRSVKRKGGRRKEGRRDERKEERVGFRGRGMSRKDVVGTFFEIMTI